MVNILLIESICIIILLLVILILILIIIIIMRQPFQKKVSTILGPTQISINTNDMIHLLKKMIEKFIRLD